MVNIENITDTHLRGRMEQALNSTHTQAPLTLTCVQSSFHVTSIPLGLHYFISNFSFTYTLNSTILQTPY